MKVIVFGSINMDLVVTAPHLPQPGETVTGRDFFTAPGGKGANQAVAAARLGAHTMMVGRVGDDDFGQPLRDSLTVNGVNIGGVQIDSGVSSGVALIAVDDRGENSIIIVAGANGRIDKTNVARLAEQIEPRDVLLLQLEVPLSAVIEAARVGADRGAIVILDPAPAQRLPDELIGLVDLLTPNETEASLLTAVQVEDDATARAAVAHLKARGARRVLLKMGSSGALWDDGHGLRQLPAFDVDAIDTVAAGDACNGGIAAALCAGLPWDEAVMWGMAAGGLATTKRGAQDAMPDRAALQTLLGAQER